MRVNSDVLVTLSYKSSRDVHQFRAYLVGGVWSMIFTIRISPALRSQTSHENISMVMRNLLLGLTLVQCILRITPVIKLLRAT